MAKDFSDNGVFNVNGQWATGIHYEVASDQGSITSVQLQFVNGRNVVAETRVDADEARELLGEENYAAMSARVDRQRRRDDGKPATGTLQGRDLAFRQVTLDGYVATSEENTIALDSRAARKDGPASTPTDRAPHQKLTARDAVVGAAHAAQMAGVGGETAHAAAQAVGLADAAKVAADAASGQEVRGVDAAAAAASVVRTAGVGGPAVQAAATVGAAAGAADTAHRALETARDIDDGQPASQAAPDATHDDAAREAQRRRARLAAVPDTVAERFLRVDDKYYFPDRTLAFVDRGNKLKAETNNTEVIRSLVAIAEARDWQAITVTGTPEFRREAWREASLRGIDVRGYDPSDVERAELRRAMERRHGPDEIGEAAVRDRESRSASPVHERAQTIPHPAASTAPSTRLATTPARDETSTRSVGEPPPQAFPTSNLRVAGRLIDTGDAPYRFQPKAKMSHYVKLQTEHGERILWGVDLERALIHSQTGARVGDFVVVEHVGSKPVLNEVPVYDDAGRRTGYKEVAGHRNTWLVEKPEFYDLKAESAKAFRQASRDRKELVDRHPDLTNAVVSLWLAEQFADRHVDEPRDRERLVALVRDRLAETVAHGEPINAPLLKAEVAKQLDAGHAEQARSNAPSRTSRKERSRDPRQGLIAPPERTMEEPAHVRM